jgi:hypothetical protein
MDSAAVAYPGVAAGSEVWLTFKVAEVEVYELCR